MSTKTTLHFTKLTLVFICLATLFGACAKSERIEPDFKPTLMGAWRLTPPVGSVDNRLHFVNDSTFIFATVAVASGSRYEELLKGTFKTKGDSLKFTVTERNVRNSAAPATITSANDKIYDKAVYALKDGMLILNYTSYPADAPVATEARFNKALVD